jgi:hypothetical protein
MAFWFLDTAGIGSLVVLAVGLSVFAAYVYVLRWIQTAPADAEADPQAQPEAVAVAETGGE